MFDQAFFLLLITACLNIAVDALARRYRPREIADTPGERGHPGREATC